MPVTPQRQAPGVTSPDADGQGAPSREKFRSFGTIDHRTEPAATRIPVPVTPHTQRQVESFTHYKDARATSAKQKAYAFKSASALHTQFTSTEANETFTSSVVNAAESLETTTVHRKFERFEEFVAVDKKHARNEELAAGTTLSNKYRCIDNSAGHDGRTRIPVPSSYPVFKTPMSASASYDPRDAYTADMAKTPAKGFTWHGKRGAHGASTGSPNPIAATTMINPPTADLPNAYYAGLSAPPTSRRNRLPKVARARNVAISTMKPTNAAPATPQTTRASIPSKKSTIFNPSVGFSGGLAKPLPFFCPATPKSSPATPSNHIVISPYQLPGPLIPCIHVPQTPDSNVTMHTPSAPVAYDKIPKKITVINGMKRSVGHDERFPILRRVRKNQPPAEEGALTTCGTLVTAAHTAGDVDGDVDMADN